MESFVAGTDGLYLATPSVTGGAWWLPWESLDAARWRLLADVEIE